MPSPSNLATTVFRATVLYALAEAQSGHANEITVSLAPAWFLVSDNGRGHPPHKQVDGVPYLRYVYQHLDFPFDQPTAGPIQLQGIGLSVVCALCESLTITSRRDGQRLTCHYAHGRLMHQQQEADRSDARGNTIEIRFGTDASLDVTEAAAWCRCAVAAIPGCKASIVVPT
jgi:DNA gyrase subunit B